MLPVHLPRSGAHGPAVKSGMALSLILLIFLHFPPWAQGFHGTVEGALGYDSNPAVTEQQTMGRRPTAELETLPGSGFGYAGADFQHVFSLQNGVDIELQAGGFNTSYFSSGSKNQGSSSINISFPFRNGTFTPSVFTGGACYRDYLVNSNSADEFFTGFQFAINMSEKVDISFDGTCRWIDYKNDIIFPRGHGGGHSGHGGHGSHEDSTVAKSFSRDDIILETGFSTVYYLSPRLTGNADVGYTRQDSSIKSMSYNQVAISMGFTLEPFEALLLDAGATYFHTAYDHTPAKQDNNSSSWRFDSRLSRAWRAVEFYAAFSWEQNITASAGENEDRSISQAGISWAF